jgi:hypothetical protein
MAQVVAITEIQHGVGEGEIKTYNVGDPLSGLSEDEQRSLVLGGSAVEIGKGRKFTEEPALTPGDEATRKRDELIAKALTGESPVSPAAAEAEDQGTVTAKTSGPGSKEGTTGQGGSK